MRAFRKLIVANFKQFFRDKTAVFFTFAFPLIFIGIFGLVFSGGETVNYQIGLVNYDNSVYGQGISQVLEEIPIFEMSAGELNDRLTELEDGDLSAVVVIPAEIEAHIAAGEAIAITVYHDPSKTTSAQIILSVLRQTVSEINQQLTQQPILLTLTEESIMSQNLRFIDFFVPGILAMSIMMTGFFGVVPLVEWREKKVLKRLSVTPLHRSTVVLSQVIFRLVLTVLQAAILLGIAYFAFDVQVIGNWLLLFGLLLLGSLSFVSIGYLVASRARTVEGAIPIINLITFPMMFLSGIFFPVEIMPDFLRPVIEALPLTYLGDAFRQIMVGAPPLHSLTTDIVVLSGWLIVCMALAIKFFRWE